MSRKRRHRSWTVGDLLAGQAGVIGDFVGSLFDNDWWWS